MGEDLPGCGAILSHQKLMEEEIHQRSVARIAQALVVEVLDPPGEGFAHRAQAARGGEGLEADPANIDRLQPFHGRNGLRDALFDDLAIVEIFVDDTLRRPVKA